jgi:hypothetical protein
MQSAAGAALWLTKQWRRRGGAIASQSGLCGRECCSVPNDGVEKRRGRGCKQDMAERESAGNRSVMSLKQRMESNPDQNQQQEKRDCLV